MREDIKLPQWWRSRSHSRVSSTPCAHDLPQTRHHWEGGCRERSSCFWSSAYLLASKERHEDIITSVIMYSLREKEIETREKRKDVMWLTQDRTPPINPIVYPVIKSFPRPARPSAPGLLGPSIDELEGLFGARCWLLSACEEPLPLMDEEEPAPAAVSKGFDMALAGLWGRLDGQNWRSSLPSSWPVDDQLERMLSRSSWT